MRIAISGSSGLVGSQLKTRMVAENHEVYSLVRSQSNDSTSIAPWSGNAEAERLNGFDVVVHLAGKPIAAGRWNDKVKREIRDSRVEPTRQLAEALADLPEPPQLLLCASAIGIYGDRGEEVLAEDSALGDDFLAGVAKQWEAACQPASDAGIRVVNARFGIILNPSGGALKQMLLPAKLFGGALGNGRQWWSWIALDDVISAIEHVIADRSCSGPVNFVAPEAMRNRDFAKTLGRVIKRPAIFPAPAFALRAAMGEMADALLLSSTRVKPGKLTESGYRFQFQDLETYLLNALRK